MSLTLITTTDGRALIPAGVVIAEVGVSETDFTPDDDTAVLPDEIKRLTTIAGMAISPDQLHMTVLDDSADTYALRSFALYLDDGTLFAAYSQPAAIMTKAVASSMILAIDIAFVDIDATLIEFGDTSFALPPATETNYGMVKLASDAETITGTNDEDAVTPAGLAAKIAILLEALATNPHQTQLGEGKWLHRAMPETDYYKFPNGQLLPLPEYQDLADALTGDPSGAFLAVDAADKLANKGKWFIADDETTIAMPDHRGDFLRIFGDDMITGGVTRPGLAIFKAGQNKAHVHEMPDSGEDSADPDIFSNGHMGVARDAPDTLSSGGDEANPDHTAVLYLIRVL